MTDIHDCIESPNISSVIFTGRYRHDMYCALQVNCEGMLEKRTAGDFIMQIVSLCSRQPNLNTLFRATVHLCVPLPMGRQLVKREHHIMLFFRSR